MQGWIKNILNNYETYRKREEELMGMMEEKLSEISYIDNLLEIKRVGMKTVNRFLQRLEISNALIV